MTGGRKEASGPFTRSPLHHDNEVGLENVAGERGERGRGHPSDGPQGSWRIVVPLAGGGRHGACCRRGMRRRSYGLDLPCLAVEADDLWQTNSRVGTARCTRKMQGASGEARHDNLTRRRSLPLSMQDKTAKLSTRGDGSPVP